MNHITQIQTNLYDLFFQYQDKSYHGKEGFL
jgi:hypothetical protein